MIKLRGHHLLCVHGFQGMGYSQDFIKKMEEVVRFIRDEGQDGPIQVEEQSDLLCNVCPNLGEGGCQSSYDAERKIRNMDGRVLDYLGLKKGEIYMKSHIVELTREKVTPEDLERLCYECSWFRYGVCKEGISRLSRKEQRG